MNLRPTLNDLTGRVATMKKKSTIVRYSHSEIEAMRERGLDKTRLDAPLAESLGADFWKSARVVLPPGATGQ